MIFQKSKIIDLVSILQRYFLASIFISINVQYRIFWIVLCASDCSHFSILFWSTLHSVCCVLNELRNNLFGNS